MRRILGNPRYRPRVSSDVPQYRTFLLQQSRAAQRLRMSRKEAQEHLNRLRTQMVDDLWPVAPQWIGIDLADGPDRTVVHSFPGRRQGRRSFWQLLRKALERANAGGKGNVA